MDLWHGERERAAIIDHGIRLLTTDSPPTAKLWNPKAKNPTANYRFRSIEAREAYILTFVEGYDRHVTAVAATKGQRSSAAAQHVNDVQVGHVFRYSWGYDQTNIQYFQVTEKHGQNLTLREIAQSLVPGSEGFMCEHVEPRIGHFLGGSDEGSSPRTNRGKPFTKRLQFTNDGRAYLAFDYGWCELWRGGSSYQSHYA